MRPCRPDGDRGSPWSRFTHRSRTVEHIEGAAAPKSVAIVEWDSLGDAQAFYKSKAWTDLAPQREKAYKTVRRYVVEVEK
jgi:uncharacterized protein (DUF1330 family)